MSPRPSTHASAHPSRDPPPAPRVARPGVMGAMPASSTTAAGTGTGHAIATTSTAGSTLHSGAIRRNLFQSHLSRHPPSAASSTSSRSNSVLDNPFGLGVATGDDPRKKTTGAIAGLGGVGDIVVKNANGEYSVVAPVIAAPIDTSEDGLEPTTDDEQREQEDHLLQLLQNRTRHSSESELLEAVQASLKRRVDALEDDRWMYEGERVIP